MHPSFLNSPVNTDYFHVKKKKSLRKDMKLTQKHVGQVAGRLVKPVSDAQDGRAGGRGCQVGEGGVRGGSRGWAQVSSPSPENSVSSRPFLCGLTVSASPSPAPLGSSQPGVGLRSLLGGGDLDWVPPIETCQRGLSHLLCLFSVVSGFEIQSGGRQCVAAGAVMGGGRLRRGWAGGLHVNSRRKKGTQRLEAGAPGRGSCERPLLF